MSQGWHPASLAAKFGSSLAELYCLPRKFACRAHSGTTDTEKLKRWINFVVAFVENSARNPEPLSFYDDRDAVHKFHRLFEWVVRGENMHRFYYGRALELNQ